MKFLVSFVAGGALYGLIELAYRRRTHWTMILTGGVCFSFLYLIGTKTDFNLMVQCLVGALFITAVEFNVGCAVNLRLHWGVWDYSDRRYHVLGQICPRFMIYWFLLCIPGIGLVNIIRAI